MREQGNTMKRQLLDADLTRYVENGTLDFNVFHDTETKSLSVTRMNVNDADIEFIASWLEKHPDTVTLNLNNNLISDAGAKQLALILQQYPAIKTLNLQFNKIGNTGVRALIEALNTIKERSVQLDLTWNQEISQKGKTELKLYSMREGSSHHHHILFHEYVHPAIVSDCPKLEDLACTALSTKYKGRLFFAVAEGNTDFKQESILGLLEQNIQKLMPEFLQAVVDENEEEVKELLAAFPKLLILEPPKDLVIESKLTWQKFYAEKALTMAAKRKQFKMFELLFSYFDQLKQDDDVQDAKKEGIDAWKAYDCGCDNETVYVLIPDEYIAEVKALIRPIEREMFPNGTEVGSRLSDDTESVLEKLLDKLAPKQAAKLNDYLDVELFLLAILHECTRNRWANSTRQSAFCIRVIGLLQSVLSPETAKMLCAGLSKANKKIEQAISEGNSISDCMSFDASAVQYKLKSGESFYRASRDSRDGLGFQFLCGLFSGDRKSGRGEFFFDLGLLSVWKKYITQKQAQFFDKYPKMKSKPALTARKS